MRRAIIIALILLGVIQIGSGEIKVGLYCKKGTFKDSSVYGIKQALDEEPDIKSEVIHDLSWNTLIKYDVIVTGSLKGLPDEAWREDILIYVRCGGGMLLHHDGVGYRGWTEPLFPELFKGARRKDLWEIKVKDSSHPIMKDVPLSFKHAYYDHITLQKGEKGKVLAVDREGEPVVVCGELEYGRVVGNGMDTGYKYFPDGSEGPAEPEGGELKILLNSIRWLSKGRLSSLPSEIVKRRKILFTKGIMALPEAVPTGRVGEKIKEEKVKPNLAWFHPIRLGEELLVRVPVQELGGRFYLVTGGNRGVLWVTWPPSGGDVIRPPQEIRWILKKYKWAGVTDIVMCFGPGYSGCVNYVSKAPWTVPHPNAIRIEKKYGNPFELILRLAKEEGIKVWNLWGFRETHARASTSWGRKVIEAHKHFYAKDKDGKYYRAYKDGGGVPDFLSKETRKYYYGLIDEYAEFNRKYGNFEGIFFDEVWGSAVRDWHGDDFKLYAEFCRKNFKEEPPEEVKKRFEEGKLGPWWEDPEDKWWRRYILFHQDAVYGFLKDIIDYAHRKGFKVRGQVAAYGHFNPMDGCCSHKLARIHDYFSYDPGNVYEPEVPYNKKIWSSALGPKFSGHRGYIEASIMRGGVGGFWGSMLKPSQVCDFRLFEVLKNTIRNTREWYGGKSACKIAILTNYQNLILSFGRSAKRYFNNNESALFDALSPFQDMDMIWTQDTQFYSRYKVLIAPPYSVAHLSRKNFNALKKWIKDGGIFISLNADISTSLEDHTQEIKREEELLGVKYRGKLKEKRIIVKEEGLSKEKLLFIGFSTKARDVEITGSNVKVLAVFEEGETPAITETKLGKGKVVGIHFDICKKVLQKKEWAIALIENLILRHYSPEIKIEGELELVSTLKKGNWILVSMVPKGLKLAPVEGKLYVDIERLGIKKKTFRVMSYARNVEFRKMEDLKGYTLWSVEDLKKGIPVFIPPNRTSDWQLPDEYKKGYLRAWDESAPGRNYEHEIIVIAPIDEPVIE